jgi:hypothetical protein
MRCGRCSNYDHEDHYCWEHLMPKSPDDPSCGEFEDCGEFEGPEADV